MKRLDRQVTRPFALLIDAYDDYLADPESAPKLRRLMRAKTCLWQQLEETMAMEWEVPLPHLGPDGLPLET